MNKRIYFDDPYQVEFESKIIDRVKHKNRTALVLEQTCFYPESGGQPADKGTLNGVELIDVREDEGRILHIVDKEVAETNVKGKVDWKTRFDYMQQHAGQHILSQSFWELMQGKTRSFHLGQDVSTLEIDIQKISDLELEKVEEEANKVIFQNREIKTYFVDEDKIGEVPLRKPPKKSGLIRVVEVSDYDFSACGGTHPSRTGEIGLIKILKWGRIRNNLCFEFVCGSRALKDYTLKNRILLRAASRFSVREEEVPDAVEKIFADLKSGKKQTKKVLLKLSELEARDIRQNAEGRVIKKVYSGRIRDDVRHIALNIIRNPGYIVLFGLKADRKAYLILARSEDVDFDMRELIPAASQLINGKGGGRPSLVELAGDNVENLKHALEELGEGLEVLDKD
jgi:alanyl-tRNA synthetase